MFSCVWDGRAFSNFRVSVHVERRTGLRVAFSDVAGPLCSAAIVVPTEASDDSGLPHVLEHCVFLGSRTHPLRGFLDTLASRCLSPGTNAATAEDHTAFSAVCAGPSGLLRLLPPLLAHVFCPALAPDAMLTEVYAPCCGDGGGGGESGVVFCEMLGRENTEGDLCEAAVHALAYDAPGGYAADTGGRTDCIARLAHADVVAFHGVHYRPERCTVVVMGPCDHDAVFEAIASVPLPALSDFAAAAPRAWAGQLPGMAMGAAASRVVRFPAEDDGDDDDASVGSVVLAWRGPPVFDVEECAALEVLCRCLAESAASPLRQRFVECRNPPASDVDLSLAPFKETLIELSFTGVSASASRKKSHGSSPLSPGVLKQRVLSFLREIKARGHVGELPGDMARAAKRHYIKLLEDFEDEPQNTLGELLLPYWVFPPSEAGFGARLQMDVVVHRLQEKPDEFWVALLDKWLISRPCIEVVMQPDQNLAEEIAEHCRERQKAILSDLGTEGVEKMVADVAKAKRAQLVPLPHEIVEALPPVPPASSVPTVPVSCSLIRDTPSVRFPVQLLRMETQFAQLRLCFDLSRLSASLRPYLVLFSELLASCQLASRRGAPEMSFTDVARQLTDDFVSISGGVGFGQDAFFCECLSDVFAVWTVSELDKFELGCRWLIDLLQFVRFTEERIETVTSNLLSEVSEVSRDGSSVCDAVSSLVTSPPGTALPNDVHIGVLVQRRLLDRVSKAPSTAVPALNAIRNHLLSCLAKSGSCVAQICVPTSFPDPLPLFAAALSSVPSSPARKEAFFAMPHPRPETVCNGRCVLVPVSGVESSFLQQWVMCDVPQKHPDFFPLLVLCELISRTEGPLYTRVRGSGLAYDASITFCFFCGMLCFSLHESTAPDKALAEFGAVIGALVGDDSAAIDAICSPFLIETARSSLIYYFHSDRATVPLVSSAALKGMFKGFATPQEEGAHQLALDNVTQADVLRVARTHLRQFTDPAARATVVVAGTSTITRLAKEAGVFRGCEVIKLRALSSSIDLEALAPSVKRPHKAAAQKKKKKQH